MEDPKGSRVTVSGNLIAETNNVRGGITAYNIIGILAFLVFFAFVVAVCAWRSLFTLTQIWTLWTPWWLLVGLFLCFAEYVFLDFLMIRLRGHMTTFLSVVSIILFIILIVGGAFFWGWELGVYCYGDNADFCWNPTLSPTWTVSWEVWFCLGMYWATVLVLIIQAIIVGRSLRSEDNRQRLTSFTGNVREVELAQKLQQRIHLAPSVNAHAQVLYHQLANKHE